MSIALIGPFGAGKGSHINTLAAYFNFQPLATGNLFRENLNQQTALGLLARNYMNQGDLVPDEIVDAMIEERLLKLDADKSILFDGFPLTRYQAQFIDDAFAQIGRQLEAVIYLNISDETALERLSGRLTCPNTQESYHQKFKPPQKEGICDTCGHSLSRRPDDNPELIQHRLKIFHRAIGRVLAYYHRQSKLIILDGEPEIPVVAENLVQTIRAIRNKEAPFTTDADIERLLKQREKPTIIAPVEVSQPSLNLLLIGAPGAGKGTQAQYIAQSHQLPHIATGDIFRANIKAETKLGQLAKSYIDRGDLVLDSVTDAMVEDRLKADDAQAGFILDGFPRNLHQAEALTDMLNNAHRQLSAALYIHVNDDEIIKRLSGRLICRDCQAPYHEVFHPPKQGGICDACGGELYQRDDDKPETIRSRLKVFHRQTEPLLQYYREAGKLVEIDGETRVDAVTEAMQAQIEALSAKISSS